MSGNAATRANIARPSDENIVRNIREKAGPSARIAFISGNFNIVHPGHMRLLKFGAEQCDFLVVGVNPDWVTGVAVPLQMRLEGIESIALVNAAVQLPSTPEDFIALLQPDLVIKGKEFECADNPEEAVIASYGGKLIFSSGEMRFSSLDMLRREFFETNFSTIQKPTEYPARHQFEIPALKRVLPKLAGLRVLVVGDLIVDEYITCDPLGMSQEDPTIVVTPIDSKTFVGGAGVVSANAKGLGGEVHYCTVIGADDAARFAERSFAEYGVEAEAFVDETRPTTRKQRYRANGKTLLRVTHLRQHPISSEIAERMLAAVERQLHKTDLLLFADFNYGCLPQGLVDAIVERAAAKGVMMAADSQASSQRSDISRFKGMALLTPTEREARLALNDFDTGIAAIGEKLRETARANAIIITLASEGALVSGYRSGESFTDRLPAFNTAPKDVAGAGDSLFAAASMAMCAGVDLWQSAYFGSLAAACQVSRVGNAPLTAADLLTEINIPNG